ncbi:MAG: hypothetical protein AAFZ38_01665 [Myxococcota bacterium]
MIRTVCGLIIVMSITFIDLAANAADTPTWSGAWRHSGGGADADAREKAIETATADLPRFKRGAARSRLGERLTPPRQLDLKLNGSNIEITRDGKTMRLRSDGTPQSVKAESGSATVRAKQEEGKLLVTVEGDNGRRKTVYERNGEKLTVSVELQAKLLSKPLRVSSTYTVAE